MFSAVLTSVICGDPWETFCACKIICCTYLFFACAKWLCPLGFSEFSNPRWGRRVAHVHYAPAGDPASATAGKLRNLARSAQIAAFVCGPFQRVVLLPQVDHTKPMDFGLQLEPPNKVNRVVIFPLFGGLDLWFGCSEGVLPFALL